VAPAEELARRDAVLLRHMRNAASGRLCLCQQSQLLGRRVPTPPLRAGSVCHGRYCLVRLLFHGLTRFLPRSALSDPSGGYSRDAHERLSFRSQRSWHPTRRAADWRRRNPLRLGRTLAVHGMRGHHRLVRRGRHPLQRSALPSDRETRLSHASPPSHRSAQRSGLVGVHPPQMLMESCNVSGAQVATPRGLYEVCILSSHSTSLRLPTLADVGKYPPLL